MASEDGDGEVADALTIAPRTLCAILNSRQDKAPRDVLHPLIQILARLDASPHLSISFLYRIAYEES